MNVDVWHEGIQRAQDKRHESLDRAAEYFAGPNADMIGEIGFSIGRSAAFLARTAFTGVKAVFTPRPVGDGPTQPQ